MGVYSHIYQRLWGNIFLLPDVDYDCPLCGKHQLQFRSTLAFPFPIILCFGCGFSGNIVSLVAEEKDIGYPDALKYLNISAPGHTEFQGTLQDQEYKLNMLARAKLAAEATRSVERFIEGFFPVDLQAAPDLINHLFFFDSSHKALLFPLFLFPDFQLGFIDSFSVISNRESEKRSDIERNYRLRSIDSPGIYLFSQAPNPLLLPDPLVAMKLAFKHYLSSHTPPPIGIYDQRSSLVFQHIKRPFTVCDFEGSPALMYLEQNEYARFSQLTREDLLFGIEDLSAAKILDLAREQIEPWESKTLRVIENNTVEDIQKMLKHYKTKNRLFTMVQDFPEITEKLNDSVGVDAKTLFKFDKNWYARNESGGYYRISREGVVEYSDIDFQIKEKLQTPSKEFYRGIVRFRGEEYEICVPTDSFVDLLKDVYCIEGAYFGKANKTWEHLSVASSNFNTIPAYDGVGFDKENKRFILPGLIITPDKIIPQNLIPSTGFNIQIPPKLNLWKDAKTEISKGNVGLWSIILGVLGFIYSDILGGKSLGIIGTTPSILRICRDDIPGWPSNDTFFCGTEEEVFLWGIMHEGHLLDLKDLDRIPDYPHVLSMIARFGQYLLRLDQEEISPDSCSINKTGEIVFRFLRDNKIDPGVVSKAAQNFVCRENTTKLQRFLFLVFRLIERRRCLDLVTIDETVTVHLDRLEELLGLEDPYWRSLWEDDAIEKQTKSRLVVKRSFWDLCLEKSFD